jgi:hypothetical protein
MKVKALKRFPHEGRQIEIGDEFDLLEVHANIMAHKGDVKIVKDQAVQTEPTAVKADTPGGGAKVMSTENTPELIPGKRKDQS